MNRWLRTPKARLLVALLGMTALAVPVAPGGVGPALVVLGLATASAVVVDLVLWAIRLGSRCCRTGPREPGC
ncbi:MAG TPA: hypothetical protein VGD84_02075, partial [Pseudonocardiaceae bacterium]